ncbi:MAG: serpin family protein [Prevotella sp.]|nr:serpin family protein [Prevotella sp.]
MKLKVLLLLAVSFLMTATFAYGQEQDVKVAVDLGLPSGLKWASCNVGATKPEEYGGYYAWGETEEKEVYSWSNYIHCAGSENTCHHIGDCISGTEYDVAHVKWGGSWRMPTKEEMDELVNNCYMEYMTYNGVNGCLFVGPNGNGIFMPIAGFCSDERHSAQPTTSFYWSGSAYNQNEAYTNVFMHILPTVSSDYRFYGFSVRPVTEVEDNPRKDIALSDEERELVKKNNDFAFNLFRKARGMKSQILSPLSITYALGMLNNGAAGKTQQEINDVLGFGDAGADAINAFCRKMLTESGELDKETKVMIANNIYVNKGYELQAPFVQKAYDYYDATPEERDFHDGETMDVINQWANDHTEGVIEKILNEDLFNPDAVSYLLNAIYFKGGWMSEFDPSYTKEEPFNGGSNVFMMRQLGEYSYMGTETYQAIHLPYGNGAYQMSVFLPRKDKAIDDVLDGIGGGRWLFKGQNYVVDLKLPRMEIESHIDLKEIMSALGMPSAFHPLLAEFPYFCNVPTFIGLMRQVAKMKVDEKGTEAAAVTVIGEAGAASPYQAEFYANRPFMFIISEQSSGTIFFIGQYMGNSQATTPDRIENKQIQSTRQALLYNLNGQRMEKPIGKGLYIQNGRKIIIK